MNLKWNRARQGWALVTGASVAGLLGVADILPYFAALPLSALLLALAATDARAAGSRYLVLQLATFAAVMAVGYLLLVVTVGS